jgi:FimV-like protein
MHRLKHNYAAFILCAFMFSLLPEVGFSLGFGQIKLYSYLNEPLDAEIELQGAEDIDTSHLIVSLASVEDFKRIELVRPYFLSKLRFEVVQQNKRAILKVTSEDAVKQPYLEFLVLLTWPEGRVVRDYTLLLDPAPFGEVSKRAANEQALQMLNKAALEESFSSAPLIPSVDSAPEMPFQDPAAIRALKEKSTPEENTISPIEVAEAKSTVGINDASAGIIVDQPKQVVAQPAIDQLQPTVVAIEPKSTLGSISTFVHKQILMGGGLVLLLVLTLTAWFLRRARFRVKISSANDINILEDIAIFDEEIKLKLDLANEYIAYQDIKNAEAILDEIIASGNSEEIKLAKGMLKKISV